MSHSRATALPFAVLLIAIVTGCGGSSEEASPAEGVARSATSSAEEAAEGMGGKSPEELRERIAEYERLIEEKRAELKELTQKLEGMSPADLAGEEAKRLEGERDALNQHIQDIREKIRIATEMLGE